MTPSLGSYLAGSLSLAVIVAALGFGAHHVRRWIAPEFSGALARLAELVLGISLFVLTLQVLGSVGLLRVGWIPIASALVGVGAGLLGRAKASPSAERAAQAPSVSPLGVLIAVGVASWSLADWSIPTQFALDRGMFGGDNTWYHLPFAARFAQEHSIAGLHYTDPLRFAVWFYPQTSELINAAGIVLFRSDFLAPLMNLGWLALGFLAAWCIGRPFGVAPATLVAAGLVFDSGVMWETQAGGARNDMMALALLLAFAALVVNGHQLAASRAAGSEARRGPLAEAGPLIVAGLAGGLAISTKLTMFQPVGVIALGAIVLGIRRGRRGILWGLGGAMLVTGGYWYARNLIHSGNPLPLVSEIGPITLPHPEQLQLFPRPPHSVAGYLFEPGVYSRWFFPQLDNALGPLWALLLVAGLAAGVYVLLRARNPILRVLAGAALLNAVLYVVTPITASGPHGQPVAFFGNTRYVMAAVLLGLMLLPLARPLRELERRRRQVLALITLAFAVTVLTTMTWIPTYIDGAVFLTAVVIWTPVILARLRSERGLGYGALAAIALAVAVPTIAAGRAQQVQYAEKRYADPAPFFNGAGPVEAFAWGSEIRGRRIGVVGAGQAFFVQYAWYGDDLSNSVQYVGVKGPNGAFTLPDTCRELRSTIDAGNYDYLVSTEYGTANTDGQGYPVGTRDEVFPVRAWLKNDPALKEIVVEEVVPQPNWVYRVDGELGPAGCGAGRKGSPAGAQ